MKRRVSILILSLTLSLLLLTSLAYGRPSDVLQVSFIDVEQGDSIWLHASDNTDILIDGGRRSAGPTVVAHLQAQGIDDVDVMVLSHGDADHIGGLIGVLQSAIPVESVIYNGQDKESDVYATLITEMASRGLAPTPAHIGQTYEWGAVDASVLNPQEAATGDQNEDSVVILVTYGDIHFLFTGDIGESAEQMIVDSGTPVAAEVLKVAHHGSKYSSSADFLEAVGAEVAVIPVGDNPYGHPTQETLARPRAAANALDLLRKAACACPHTTSVLHWAAPRSYRNPRSRLCSPTSPAALSRASTGCSSPSRSISPAGFRV